MKVIICEKPSLAKNVADALNIRGRKDGYIEGNDYIVTWCFGHLLTLKDLKDYENYDALKWVDITVPIVPDPFEYKVKDDAGVKKQLKIIKQLLKNADEVINCGDADREGQLIIDNVINYCNYKGKIKRLWLPEQTPDTIKEAIKNMKDNSCYDNLNREGLARTYMDWLFGINLTIHLTNKAGTLLKAGRVLIPIVRHIYDRDHAIKTFKPTPYFMVENKKNIPLTYKKKFDEREKEEAKNIMEQLNSNRGKVINITEKEVEKNPKKLFSLSSLQSELSKKYDISFQSSLKIIQELYEKGYLTYPRTNTEYLAEEEKGKVKQVIEKIKEGYKINNISFKDKKTIFDSSKIESHSAITPTTKLPNIKELKEDEQKVYNTVLNRFLANFATESCIILQKEMEIQVGNNNFKIKGKAIKNKGYLEYESEKIENELPNYNLGDEFEIDFKLENKMTTAPAKINESSLSNYLKNPFKKQKLEEETEEEEEENTSDDEDYKMLLKGVEIGTEATRTGIIENAIKIGYIRKNKKNLEITELGEKFIELLDKLKINLYAEKTVEFSQLLKKVYNNEVEIENLLENVRIELRNIYESEVSVQKFVANEKKSFGKCLKCGADIYKGKTKNGKTNYYCSNYRGGCNFTIWGEQKFFKEEIKLKDKDVKDLLKGEAKLKIGDKTDKFRLKISQWNGKEYVGLEKVK